MSSVQIVFNLHLPFHQSIFHEKDLGRIASILGFQIIVNTKKKIFHVYDKKVTPNLLLAPTGTRGHIQKLFYFRSNKHPKLRSLT